MSRRKGAPVYPNKSKLGSYWITAKTWTLLQRAAARTGKSASDIIEHSLREVAPSITKKTFEAVVREAAKKSAGGDAALG